MRRIAAVLALALALVVPCAANAAEAHSGGTSTSLVIKLKVGPYQEVPGAVDRAPAGPSKGDIHRLLLPLYNTKRQFGKPRGARVGQIAEYDQLTSRTTAIVQGVASLSAGKIAYEGKGPTSSFTTPLIRIVGGTGRFANARGTVVMNPGLITFHLVLP